MNIVYDIALKLHVLGGTIGLLSMGIPLLAPKGGRTHKRAGWAFAMGMGLVSITGFVMAAAWVLRPAVFQPNFSVRDARLNGMFLSLIAMLTANALLQAIFAIARKNHPQPRRHPLELGSLSLLAAFALMSVALGVSEQHILSIIFGLGSLALGAQDLRFVLRPLPSKMAWWYQHMLDMSTCCTSAITAFLVLGARRYFGNDAFGASALLFWIVPSVVIPPLFSAWIASYRRKFEQGAKLRERSAPLATSRS